MMNKTFSTRALTLMAMLGGLSAVLMLFEVPLPFAPAYMKFDLSDLPALFAAFFLGPLSGGIVCLIKIAIKLILQGTSTAFVGEFMNLLCSLAFVLPAGLVYKYRHTKKSAALGMLSAASFASIFAVFANLYIALPMYVSLYGISMDTILAMTRAVNPMVQDMTSFLIFCILPFNLIKYTIVSSLTYALYKRTSNALHRLLDKEGIPQTVK